MEEKAEQRREILNHLSRTKFISHREPEFFHGRLYCGGGGGGGGGTEPPSRPELLWECEWLPRTDSSGPHWLTASEYGDSEGRLREKVGRLAQLLQLSQRTIIYSGAGISSAAGIATAARTGGQLTDLTTDAEPTLTHRALAELRRAGLVSHWVQQNHDGLPQKAGFPQEDVLEVHGSWYDPSNPVVCYDGTVRRDIFQRMKEARREADLVLVLGTSLSGLNCDTVATQAADRSLDGDSLGSVIINLQQTEKDGIASLRVFGETDHVFRLLVETLGLTLDEEKLWQTPSHVRVEAPYNKIGQKSSRLKMMLDLSPGQKIRLNPYHNCQGSRQPKLLHIYGRGAQDYQVVCRPPGPGLGVVKTYLPQLYAWEIEVEGVTLLLGGWWLEAAARGRLASLPVVNLEPLMGIMGEEGTDWDSQEEVERINSEEEARQREEDLRRKDEENEALESVQTKLEDISVEAVEIEQIMQKALENMEKTKNLVKLIEEENKKSEHF